MQTDVTRLWMSRDALVAHQERKLAHLLRTILPDNAFWAERFRGTDLKGGDSLPLEEFRKLPLTGKVELANDQAAFPPYGSNLTYSVGQFTRFHQTSGTTTGHPLRILDTPDSWKWVLGCWDSIYRLLELNPDDRLCFPFSFGPFLGFWAGFEGAVQQGRMVIAAGGMGSEARLRLILDNAVTMIGCTPTYALRLAEVAQANGIDLPKSAVRAILVAGEPGGNIPQTRQRIEQAWGARVFDHWGMTELGPLATECADDPGNLTVLETECFAEVLDRETLQPVQPGQMGELVVTNFGRLGAPMIRYRTGDLVKLAAEPHASGRILMRLEGGVLGRTDDMLIIRGNNLFPSSLEAIVREFPEIVEFRLVVSEHREMQHLRLEIEPLPEFAAQGVTLVKNLSVRLKERLSFQTEIQVVPPESLPRFEMKAKRVVREKTAPTTGETA